VKAAAAITATAVAVLLSLPFLAARPAPPAADTSYSTSTCSDVAAILQTIRTLESGGNYTAKAAKATASGAYQIIDTTWAAWALAAGIGTTYTHASQAPPAIQDAVAAHHVQGLLLQYHDVSVIPLAWYYPAAINDQKLRDVVPAPQAGNVLTPRQYQTRWLDRYTSIVRANPSCAPHSEHTFV
jgi:hypothetical protein